MENPYENITTIVLIDPDFIVNEKFQYIAEELNPIGERSPFMSFKEPMVKKYTNTTVAKVQGYFVPLSMHVNDLRSVLLFFLFLFIIIIINIYFQYLF